MGLTEEPASSELIGSRSVCVASSGLCSGVCWCGGHGLGREEAWVRRSQWSRRAWPCRGLVQGVRWVKAAGRPGRPEPVLIFLAASLAGLFTQKLTHERGAEDELHRGDTCQGVPALHHHLFYCDRSTRRRVYSGGNFPWLCCLLSENKPAYRPCATSWLNQFKCVIHRPSISFVSSLTSRSVFLCVRPQSTGHPGFPVSCARLCPCSPCFSRRLPIAPTCSSGARRPLPALRPDRVFIQVSRWGVDFEGSQFYTEYFFALIAGGWSDGELD